MTLSTAEVNYLVAIYKLSIDGNRVSTNALANEFSIAPASVTDMVQKLADKDLVEYIPYKGVSLSPSAVPIVQESKQKHQLWSTFLTDKLGISDTTIGSLVSEFQEIRSEIVLNRLKDFLQQENGVKTVVREVEVPVEVIKEIEVPVEVIVEKEIVKEVEVATKEQKQATLFDLPRVNTENTKTESSVFEHTPGLTLAKATIGKVVVVLGVKQLEQDLREIIQHYDIKIGQEVKILTQYDFDNSYLVEIGGLGIILSERVAEQILVS